MEERKVREEKCFRAAFHSIPGVGSARLRQLIARFGSASAAWQAKDSDLRGLKTEPWVYAVLKERERFDPWQIEEELAKKGIQTVIPEEHHYPALLRELADTPPLLYYQGQLEPDEDCLAIVGSRKATPYGRNAAEFLAKGLASEGFVIVSGLARGIDTAAHKGALAGRGKTWAVLGSGFDYLYPPENKKLAEEIRDRGALISEFAPGVPPEPQFFPMRNRIISGVAHGVIVVEAAAKSGALITVDFALEQGREVFAVPGPIFSQQSKGCHHLLRQGAKLVEGVEDILAELPHLSRDGKNKSIADMPPENEGLSPNNDKVRPHEHEAILSLLSDVPLHIDQITQQSGTAPSQVALVLLELQLSGDIEQLPGQRYVLAHKC